MAGSTFQERSQVLELVRACSIAKAVIYVVKIQSMVIRSRSSPPENFARPLMPRYCSNAPPKSSIAEAGIYMETHGTRRSLGLLVLFQVYHLKPCSLCGHRYLRICRRERERKPEHLLQRNEHVDDACRWHLACRASSCNAMQPDTA